MNQLIIDTITELEERLKLAMSTSDVDELDMLLSDDLVFTSHFGAVISKKDDLNMHTSGDLKIEDIQLSDQKILPYEDIAIVTAGQK
jgi:hypothetical protein